MKIITILLSFGLILSACQAPSAEDSKTEKAIVVSHRSPDLKSNRYNVAFLIMDGVYNTELTAPYDIFQHTIFRDGIKAMNTFMVADTYNTITTFEGMRIIPDFNYIKDSLPKIDILVVPSAEHHLDSDLENENLLAFIRKVDKEAQFITSHCDGAFVLAKAGILDNVESTTFPADIATYKKMFPQLKVHKNVLFVHDGKYITSAGGAKSFEAALYLAEVLYGKDIAKRLAQGLMIDWDLETVAKIIVKK